MVRQKPIIQIDAEKQRELGIDSEMGVDKAEKYILENTEVRPSVYLHARKMESRLREKDATRGHDGWHDGKFYYYLAKVASCIRIILKIIKITIIGEAVIYKKNSDIKVKDIHLALKKCYDGSNFFMMLADNFRDELVKRGIKGNGK